MPSTFHHLADRLQWAMSFVRRTCARRPRGDRGEGVLSAAIAVLIFAFLGTVMWYGFKATFSNAQTKTDNQVELIGK